MFRILNYIILQSVKYLYVLKFIEIYPEINPLINLFDCLLKKKKLAELSYNATLVKK